jgi:protein ImuA
VGGLIELLVQQPGIGEIRLLHPALSAIAMRPIALMNPPYVVSALGFAHFRIRPEQLLLLRTGKTADTLWSAERILHAGTCGALVLWDQHIRPESLRRLYMAAQSSPTLFLLMRPLAAAQDSSPATLRLALRPNEDGVLVDIIHRRGHAHTVTFSVATPHSRSLLSERLCVGPAPIAAVRSQTIVYLCNAAFDKS